MVPPSDPIAPQGDPLDPQLLLQLWQIRSQGLTPQQGSAPHRLTAPLPACHPQTSPLVVSKELWGQRCGESSQIPQLCDSLRGEAGHGARAQPLQALRESHPLSAAA